MTQNPELACQQEDVGEFSRLSCPYPLLLVRRLFWHLKTRGFSGTIHRTMEFARLRLPGALRPLRQRSQPGSQVESASARLRPGDWVEVKAESEILATLDHAGKHNGLAFLPEMRSYCGQRFTVFKRIERIFLEESKQIRRMKNTVILTGVMCRGEGVGCDRSCFLYWREAWLRRMEASQANTSPPA